MATKAKTGKTKKVAISDVSHPGTTAPSDTSVPIITHRPIIKDPMMVESKEDTEEAPSKPALMKGSELKVEPPKAEPAAQEEAPASEPPDPPEPSKEDESEKPAEDGPATENSQPPEPAPDKPEETRKKSKKADPDAEDAAAAEAEAKVEGMIESKKYFLPINAVEHRRSRRFVLLGIILAVVLALAWVDVALDSGIIKLGGVKAPIHFFSN